MLMMNCYRVFKARMICVSVCLAVASIFHIKPSARTAAAPTALQFWQGLPVFFEPNDGQFQDASVRYIARHRGQTLVLKSDSTALALHSRSGRAVIATRWVGGNSSPCIEGIAPTAGQSHDFTGSRAEERRQHLP